MRKLFFPENVLFILCLPFICTDVTDKHYLLRSCLLMVVIVVARFLSRGKLNHIVDSQNGNGGFGRERDALDLRHGRLQNTGFNVVADLSAEQIQTVSVRIR